MRISTLNMQVNAMTKMLSAQERVKKSMEEVTTGKKFSSPSDNPVASSKSNIVRYSNSLIDVYQQNNITADNQLSKVEDTLEHVNDVLLRVNELQKQSLNGILKESDKKMIANEVEQRLTELVSLANTRDSQGNYIFSGYKSTTPAYTKQADAINFQGDGGQRSIQVGSDTYVPTSYSGEEVFESVKNGNGHFVTKDGVANNTGTGIIALGSVVDQGAYVDEDYSIRFVTNSSSDLAYEVFGSISGQLVPALPAVSPADAPKYSSGSSINFNGIDISITGEPNMGDDFSIEPSSRQNIFTSLQNIIDALRMPDTNSVEHAKYVNEMDRAAAALDSGMEQVIFMITKVGANDQLLESQKIINDDLKLYNEKSLSAIEDIDPAEAISRLSLDMNMLQTAQAGFSKIMQLSLFNFI